MAELPAQSKLKIREIVQLEFEITALVQKTRNIRESQVDLNQLNSKVKKLIQSLRRKLEELKQIGEEQDKKSSHVIIKEEVNKHYQNLSRMQANFRQANMMAQISIEKYEKNQLMSGGKQNELKQRHQSKEALAKTAGSITESLMSIAKMMENQVQQSASNTELLTTSSKGLSDTNEELKGLSGFVHTSKQLLNKYNRRETTDKLLIFFGLVLFFCTVLYIVKKRIFPSQAV